VSSLDLLTAERSLVVLDAVVASSDPGLVRKQNAVFKASELGGRMGAAGEQAR